MYVLESDEEAQRLEKQNKLDIYSIDEELREVNFEGVKNILDLGCGSGSVSRKLKEYAHQAEVTGVDQSEVRLQEARKIASQEGYQINFLEGNLNELPFKDETFDMVTCRFVFHHLFDPKLAVQEIKRVLKKNGKVVLIDSDGILFNLYSEDTVLQNYLKQLKLKMPMDLFVGRKLKSFLLDLGFNHLESRIIPMHFINESLIAEKEQYEQRFFIMKETLKEMLGEERHKEFVTRYLDALNSSGAELFYNKFVVQGTK